MQRENRRLPRTRDCAKVNISKLCVFPGVLEDISMEGCRVRFSTPFTVNEDTDYTITIHPARKTLSAPLTLLGRPAWVQKHGDSLEIGFRVFRSPDTRRLAEYIAFLNKSDASSDEVILSEVCL